MLRNPTNYRPYPPSGNIYHGRSGMPSEERILEVERSTKNFMQMQYEQNNIFTKTMEEQSIILKNISHLLENLNREIPSLQSKNLSAEKNISPLSEAQSSLINKIAAKPEAMENTFATAHSIQFTIDENVRLL